MARQNFKVFGFVSAVNLSLPNERFLARGDILKMKNTSQVLRVGIYARVSSHEQNPGLQLRTLRQYVKDRKWLKVIELQETESGASRSRPMRQQILDAARRRQIDVVLVWKLDRWSRSLLDLFHTLQELRVLEVGFISLTEALDLTTPTGRAMTGMLGVFAEFEREILQERIRAGIREARLSGGSHGRPITVGLRTKEVKELHKLKTSKSEIARKLGISRTSVRRLIETRSGK
jgi:putative DNA-invertase from lambdoid prophage Rac